MRYSARTIVFFITWGILYGTILGGISGTLIFPMFGTMYSAPWGLGMGAALGVATGFLALIANALHFKPDMDITAYRRNLATGIGGFTALGAATLLIATTNGFLWGSTSGSLEIWLVFSLIAAVFWGGLSAAFAASRFVDWYAALMTKRKNDEMPEHDLNDIEQRGGSVWSYLKRVFRNWWILSFAVAAVAIIHTISIIYFLNSAFEWLSTVLAGIVGGFVYGGALMLMLGFHTGFFLYVLNRLIFREYFPNFSFQNYRRSITVLAALFTMATGVVVTAGIGAIPAGAIAGWCAWRYADWYAAEPEKDKRKARESAGRLSETLPDELPDDVEDYMQAVERSKR
jgi:hypothetical protein